MEFNYASGINSDHLETFMQTEVDYFVHYCSQVTEQKKDFNIREYINLRNSSKAYSNDPYYFSSEFVTFLEQKYEQNPGEEELFSLREYYLHFWQYFYLLLGNNKNVVKYFDEEIAFYKEFEEFMGEHKLTESFLAYRMWRVNRKQSTFLPSLRNPFFLQTYIYSFIQSLIEQKLYYPHFPRTYDFQKYSNFLHDYVFFLADKKEEFSFERYREYFEFRRKGEKFE
jgi:hypothetical protein